VDNFIQIKQGGAKRMCGLRNHLLTAAAAAVLAQPKPGDNHNKAISFKKLLINDAVNSGLQLPLKG
jgi:hypothetical protein